jgi:ribosomal protein S7
MTIITKGMGAILKAAKKRKTLTVDKGALRISEINKKLKKTPRAHQQSVAEDHAQEVLDIYKGKKSEKAVTKKGFVDPFKGKK